MEAMKRRMHFVLKLLRRVYGMGVLGCAWLCLKIIHHDFLEKNIWIVCEKRNEARDNGFHFFKYLREQHPETQAYYVITKDSADFDKVAALGNIVIANSFTHCLLYLSAKYNISSQPYGAYPFSFSLRFVRLANRLCRRDQKIVFLQHGIIKDELSHNAFDYDKCNIDFFVCSAPREYEFVKERYGYPEKNIGCVGLCRFDHLLRNTDISNNAILVMPTWRMWLRRTTDGVALSKDEIQEFRQSDFYKQYVDLLTDKQLIASLREKHMRILFYMHYQLQDYTPLFKNLENDIVVIADRYNFDVQKLLMTSNLLITDYSSVFFDFAYMNKPLLYYQFDKTKFEGSHYTKGYFEYEHDGFGPCVYAKKEVVDAVLEYIENDCKQPQIYAERVRHFFMNRDGKNCERTFQAISRL